MAIEELRKRFSLVAVSKVYRNEAVGFEGEAFLNAVARVVTDRSPVEVCAELDEIHDMAGRERGSRRFVSRTLDIDLLMYDQQVIEDFQTSKDPSVFLLSLKAGGSGLNLTAVGCTRILLPLYARPRAATTRRCEPRTSGYSAVW